jgi:hypothetical protein
MSSSSTCIQKKIKQTNLKFLVLISALTTSLFIIDDIVKTYMILILFFCFSHLQKYIEEKVGPNEQLAWAKQHIEKGLAGKLSLSGR